VLCKCSLMLLLRIRLQDVQYTVSPGGTVSRNSTGRAHRSRGGRYWSWWPRHYVRLRDRWDNRMYAINDCSRTQTQRQNSWTSTQWCSAVGQTGYQDAGKLMLNVMRARCCLPNIRLSFNHCCRLLSSLHMIRMSSHSHSFLLVVPEQTESCAIAKMTARCALYMGALKIIETPWLPHGYFSQNLQGLYDHSALFKVIYFEVIEKPLSDYMLQYCGLVCKSSENMVSVSEIR